MLQVTPCRVNYLRLGRGLLTTGSLRNFGPILTRPSRRLVAKRFSVVSRPWMSRFLLLVVGLRLVITASLTTCHLKVVSLRFFKEFPSRSCGQGLIVAGL